MAHRVGLGGSVQHSQSSIIAEGESMMTLTIIITYGSGRYYSGNTLLAKLGQRPD
jgi:hypothetical protein